MGIFDTIKNTVMNTVLPRKCPLCGKMIAANEHICGSCSDTLVMVRTPICRVCGREMFQCVCDYGDVYYDRCVSPFVYTRSAREGVKRLKYKNSTETAEFFGRRMAITVKQEYKRFNIDVVTCVPSHLSDMQERGYNHAALIGRSVAKSLGLRYSPNVLTKPRANKKQHTLNRNDRKLNVEGAFKVSRPDVVIGATVLLCDDVSTTGCTLSECAKALKEAGAKRVLCVTATAVHSSYMTATKQAMLS